MFPPDMGKTIDIRGETYRMAEHPLFANMPYGQEGRQGTVYQLLSQNHKMAALKVLKPAFRHPSLVKQARLLNELPAIKGLEICQRYVLNPQEDSELLAAHPELLYAINMPWIDGVLWTDVLLERSVWSDQQALNYAIAFANLMMEMEQIGIAHTDLSSANIVIQHKESEHIQIGLIDVEGLYAETLEEPEYLPDGATGYSPLFLRDDPDWSAYSDRFSGSMIMMEMLSRSDQSLVDHTWGESYFDPADMQHPDSKRYIALQEKLADRFGQEIVNLLARVWNAEQLQQCPSFGEWYVVLTAAQVRLDEQKPLHSENNKVNDSVSSEGEAVVESSHSIDSIGDSSIRPITSEQQNQLEQARHLERVGNKSSALWKYGVLLEELSSSSPLYIEISVVMAEIQQQLDEELEEIAPPPPMAKKLLQQAMPEQNQSLYHRLWVGCTAGACLIVVLALLIYIIKGF